MLQRPIYLDNNATTRVDARVLDAMLPYFTELFGNPASQSHTFGQAAAAAVERARQSIAAQINAHSPEEIVFCSGATESDNLAIKGAAEAHAGRRDHLITVTTEHKAVLESCRHLEKQGFRVTYLGVGRDGLLDLNELVDAMTERTLLVSVMAVNNEIGVIQDLAAIGRLCRERGVLFHTDATQSVGKIPFDVQAMQIDLASFTAHKIYGPKGVGALYVRRRDPAVRLRAQADGGGNEGGLRSGTLNVPGIVGLAKAVEVCMEEMETETKRLVFLREKLKRGIQEGLEAVYVNGHEAQRAPGNLNLAFAGIAAEGLLARLPDIALSAASACLSASATPSHVLRGIGLPDDLAHASVRFSIGRYNTEKEIDYTVGRVVEVVRRLRAKSPTAVGGSARD